MHDVKWAIDKVTIGDRHRIELGDIASLAASIDDVGILHPVVVTPAGLLVAGRRRLEACRSLGWKRVPVTVVSTLGDAQALLRAERDENTCRLDMKISEKVSLGTALEELERPKARERQAIAGPEEGPGKKSGSDKISEAVKGETRHIVGAALGMSGTTYERAKTVVRASEDPALPEEHRKVVAAARAEMDRTGKVAPAFNVVAPLVGRSTRPDANGASKPTTKVKTKTYPGRSASRGLQAILGTLVGLTAGLDSIDDPDIDVAADEAAQWESELAGSVRSINRIRKLLKGRVS